MDDAQELAIGSKIFALLKMEGLNPFEEMRVLADALTSIIEHLQETSVPISSGGVESVRMEDAPQGVLELIRDKMKSDPNAPPDALARIEQILLDRKSKNVN
jgi:hypothetical protein